MIAQPARLDTVRSLESLFCNPDNAGQPVQARPGQVLFDAADPATDVYYIHSGQVRLHQLSPDGVALLLEILSPGQWFGVAAFAGRSTQGIRATSVVASSLTKVSAKAVLSHVCATPDGAAVLIQELAGRSCSSTDDAARLVFDDCNSRLIKTLLRFSDTSAASPRQDGDGAGVVLHITHEQLAQALGVARETVSLALTQLRRQNILQTGRNKLVFDPAVLRSFQSTSKRPAAVPS